MAGRFFFIVLCAAALIAPTHAAEQRKSPEGIPAHQEQKIRAAVPDKPRVSPKKPRKVLIWNTPSHLMDKDPHKGYCVPYGACAMRLLGEKTGAFTPVISEDLALFLPENIKQFDAIILNNACGPWITPSDAAMEKLKAHGATKEAVEQVLRKSLLDYVSNGGGIMALHYAIAANPKWPEFGELIGGKFIGHPWNEEVAVRVEEPTHPLAAAFAGKDFRLADEIYEFGPPYDRSKLRVLMSLDTMRTNMGVKWIHRTDNDFAQAWVKTHGQGRIFYTGFGHRTEIYWHPAILQFYLDGIQFATGDLEAPTAPRPATDGEAAFQNLFNGKDLAGWQGDPSIWSVQDGAIVGQTSGQVRVKENTFLIWQGGQPRDFELQLKYKLTGGNSGIYFHAEQRAEGAKGEALVGPQADFSADHRWTGVLMEYTKREILAERGQRVRIDSKGNKQVLGSIGDPKELLKAVKEGDWNDYTVISRGPSLILKINGQTMCEVSDQDPSRTPAGHLALQVHVGPPMRVDFKDIRLRP